MFESRLPSYLQDKNLLVRHVSATIRGHIYSFDQIRSTYSSVFVQNTIALVITAHVLEHLSGGGGDHFLEEKKTELTLIEVFH